MRPSNNLNRTSSPTAHPSRSAAAFKYLLLVAGGLAMSAAFPPLNWGPLAFIAMIPLVLTALNSSAGKAALAGLVWGVAWALPAFWWLREIEMFIPFAIAPLIAVTPMIFALTLRWFYLGSCVPLKIRLGGFFAEDGFCVRQVGRELFFILGSAAFWCVLDVPRLWMFPWNFLHVTQWQNVPLLQICRYTGSVAITFLIVAVNLAAALALRNTIKSYRLNGRPMRPWPLFILLALLLAIGSWGYLPVLKSAECRNSSCLRFGVIQGDISQRRKADPAEAAEALETYLALSHQLIRESKEIPQVLIWPETAVPYPYFGMYGQVTDRFRSEVAGLCRRYQMPLLLGTLDPLDPFAEEYDFTNSAILIGANGKIDPASHYKYDKIHRVPFGEFVPLADYLPEWYRRAVDMGRDLIPGGDARPLEIAPGVRAGMSICYESVFSSLARREARLGANLLVTLSNDAWYPTSSEPEQHLANALVRTIETGLPALRVGNNGGSLVINGAGVITEQLMPYTERGRRAGILTVFVPDRPPMTFFVRYGEVFYWLLGLLALVLALYSLQASRRFRAALLQNLKKTEDRS